MNIITKKIVCILFVLLSFTTAHAYDAYIDGIYYNLNGEDRTAEVTFKDYYDQSYSGSVSIPEKITYDGVIYTVTSIGERAFEVCRSLTSVTIPNSVKSIGVWAFSHCSCLESISVASDNEIYDSRDDCNAIIEKSSNTLIAGCMNTIIPNSVTRIGEDAFDGSGLTSITIPNSVTSIGDGAFSYCSSLTSITIPNSVTSIGWYAFDGCSGLTSITIPNSVKSIGEGAFDWCSRLESMSVASDNEIYDSRDDCNAIIKKSNNTLIAGCKNTIIPNSVTSIGMDAFAGSGLTSITIPNSVTRIGMGAFLGCSGLTSITIPNSVTRIGNAAFSGCI